MNYDLALKLKNAGFPQIKESIDEVLYAPPELQDHPSAYVRIPTLSEIIEACGDKFALVGLDHQVPNDREEKWYAQSIPIKNIEPTFGKTPEIAVANLWLALNEKK